MSSSQPLYTFNGTLSTDKTVLQNLETLTEACNSFLTFDINTGKWCVIINKPGDSVKSFDNSNIIGSIAVSGTGLNDLYNKVIVEFPHKDLADQIDAVISQVPNADLLPNEQPNILNLKYDIINDPIQAELLGTTKLKQSRIDKIIKFRTDFSSLGLKAGDLVDVTSDVYGYTNKVFRVISIEEEDAEDGSIVLAITALEYDDGIYDTSGLHRLLRTPLTGITQKSVNEAIQADEDSAFSNNMLSLLLPLAATSLFNAMFPGIKKALMDAINKPSCGVSLSPETACEGSSITATVTYCKPSCADFTGAKVNYEITGVDAADIGVPLTGEMSLGSTGVATLQIPLVNDGTTEGNETLTFTVEGKSATATIKDRLGFTYTTSATPLSFTEGQYTTVTLTTSGLADGTSVPYTISGSASSKVTIPLTGTTSILNNQSTLIIPTTDDAVYTGTQNLTVTFNPDQADPCGQLDKTVALSVLDNETPPPQPPENTDCNPIPVPVFWCPVYDGVTGEVIRLDALKYANFCSPVSGGTTATVPLTVSVTKGNPSTVTILTTATVDAGTTRGGQEFLVQTSFNSIAPNGAVSGTTVKLVGY